ncbi:MAG: hypothetical protein OEW11_10865 [Nitrospirota bacterium]|nr:hypothetical protein [Nitrospirota bacterium]
MQRKLMAATLLAALTAAATPAHAYKVNDTLEVNAKLFANVLSVEKNSDKGGFHLDRSYLEVRRNLEGGDLIRVTLDQKAEADSTLSVLTPPAATPGTGTATKSADGRVFVKYAYWQHQFAPVATLKAGLNHTPMVDFDESKFWGFRFVAKSFTDEWGLQTSSDLGLSLLGKVADGKLEYHLSGLNGEGYQHPVNGNGYAFAARVGANLGGLHTGVLSHREGNRNGVSGYDPERDLVYAFFSNDAFRIGGQYLVNADDGTSATKFHKASGYNVQGAVSLPFGNKTEAFARYDTIDPMDTGVDKTLTLAGISFQAGEGVTVAPTMRIDDDGVNPSITTWGVFTQMSF